MNRVYEVIKGKELKYYDYSGYVCGYTEDKFILATTDKTEKSFRKFHKGDMPFIEEGYKDVKFRYVWIDEIDVEKQHSKLKNKVEKIYLPTDC